jgi:hypothetical protein
MGSDLLCWCGVWRVLQRFGQLTPKVVRQVHLAHKAVGEGQSSRKPSSGSALVMRASVRVVSMPDRPRLSLCRGGGAPLGVRVQRLGRDVGAVGPHDRAGFRVGL